jgi:predicted transcriptional regulator
MAANRRTKTEREAVLAKVAELDLNGYGQVAIARLLGVSQPQVSYDLKVVRKRYRETQLATVKAAVNRKIDQLADVRSEAWEAWDESRKKGKADVECMAIILKALKMECELLGLYPPKEVKKAPTVAASINWWESMPDGRPNC